MKRYIFVLLLMAMCSFVFAEIDVDQLIANSMDSAKMSDKYVLLVFGSDWCPDCQALERYFLVDDIGALLAHDYVKVNIDIGRFDKHTEIALRYGIEVKKGIPAIVILNGRGELLYAMRNGEWSNARKMKPEDVLIFLQKIVSNKIE